MECQQFFQTKNIDLRDFDACDLDYLPGIPSNFTPVGSASGGYVENLKTVAKELFGIDGTQFEEKTMRYYRKLSWCDLNFCYL